MPGKPLSPTSCPGPETLPPGLRPVPEALPAALPRRWRVRRRPAGPGPPLPVPAMRPPRPSRPLPARRCPCGPRRRSPPVPTHPPPGPVYPPGLEPPLPAPLRRRRSTECGRSLPACRTCPEGGCQVPGGSPTSSMASWLWRALPRAAPRCSSADSRRATASFPLEPPGGGTGLPPAAPVPPDLPALMPRRLHPAHSQARRPGPPPGPSHRRRHPGSAPAGR